jgi:hypothetical protein
MLRVYAPHVVARMADITTVWYFAVDHPVNVAVRGNQLPY